MGTSRRIDREPETISKWGKGTADTCIANVMVWRFWHFANCGHYHNISAGIRENYPAMRTGFDKTLLTTIMSKMPRIAPCVHFPVHIFFLFLIIQKYRELPSTKYCTDDAALV